MALLPDDRLICHKSWGVMLFDLNDAVVGTTIPIQSNQASSQRPVASFHWRLKGISRPYLIHDTIRFSVVSDLGIKGLVIPCSRSAANIIDCVDLVSDTTFETFTQVAYDRVVGNHESQGPVVARFTWPDDVSSSVATQNKIINPRLTFTSNTLFDSSSSRIVVFRMISDDLSIFQGYNHLCIETI